ncbi:unnamed protein product [Notodromas monacha]|uniref:RRM domain-containing protein n=1 Tax=Notodromas monacha TaxID=399045 RepID=A0A7R9BE71_9CRUS|nr:unnamed protein product [Notodromas monacha]CAG0913695.1 unnamed protein product [Notodromas monacha]
MEHAVGDVCVPIFASALVSSFVERDPFSSWFAVLLGSPAVEVRTFAVPTSEIPPIKSIVITPNAGGRRTAVCGLSNATARVFVTDPAGLDGFHPRTVNTNLGREHQSPTILALSLSPTDALLCVAHLPLSLGESEFRGLVDKFGPVKRAFIMRSRRTGMREECEVRERIMDQNKDRSKTGYGFVEYADKECAFAAKTWLDTKRREEAQVQARPRSLVTPTLSCDWLDCGIVTVAGLDSNCLCVAGLPRENPNMSELRTAMSVHVNPPYCQDWPENCLPSYFNSASLKL